MKHNFLSHTNLELIQLKTGWIQTLKNPVCADNENFEKNIKQIDEELRLRGIKPLKQTA